jgi:hypothetical protein
MKIKDIFLETLISGFSHLVWLIMFIILLSEMDATKFNILFATINTISVGVAAILASIIFGSSFFLGSLANRILSDILSLFNDPPDQATLNKARENNKSAALAYDLSWLNKNFFLSMAVAGLFILILSLLLDRKYMSENNSAIILIIGLPIVCTTIIALFTQRNDFHKKKKDLINN